MDTIYTNPESQHMLSVPTLKHLRIDFFYMTLTKIAKEAINNSIQRSTEDLKYINQKLYNRQICL